MNQTNSNEQSDYVQPRATSDADSELLEQIREDYKYCLEYWDEIRDDMAKDMRYVAGDPWNPDDRAAREDAGRPCVTPDELSQYLKQANNTLRQNKRAVKVNPKGMGATDKDAERRQAIIRGIEYMSNAQAAYSTGFEQCTSSSMGFWRLKNEYVHNQTDEQEPRIKRIPNQFSVLPDPLAKEADRSDSDIYFVADKVRMSAFGRRFPKAKTKSFDQSLMAIAPDWFKGEDIIVAEYWRREKVPGKKIRNRQTYDYKVTQYITNGIEILEKNDWPGSWIPIIGVFGEELYTQESGSSKLKMYSMIRRARVPQMMMAYIASQEAEEFGMAPRAPYLAIEGQLEGHEDEWKNSNKQPYAVLQYKATLDTIGGGQQILPPPTRQPFVPNVAAYEAAKESWRRAIQAAMGQTPLPTAAQRQNEKSGIALERIQTQQAIGTYNFVDNFDRALMNTGRQLNELITKLMDTPRLVPMRKPDDTHALMAAGPQQHMTPEVLQELGVEDNDYLITDRGEFDVTISTGPSDQSEREEGTKFASDLLQSLPNIPPPGSPAAKILAKAIRLKAIGPIGDDIAEILDPNPEEQLPPQAQAAISQAQQQSQALNAYAQKLEAEKQQLEFEKKAEVQKLQQQFALKKMEIEADLAKAEILTKAQVASEREAFVNDIAKQVLDQLHQQDLATQAQAHDQQMAAQQAQAQQQLADQNNQASAQQQQNQITADQASQAMQAAQAQEEPAQGANPQ